MPKSFLVKNKKARRIEEETQDGTKPARCEEKIVGKKNLHISLQGKIFLVPRSTWPFDKRFCSQFLRNISCALFHRYKVP